MDASEADSLTSIARHLTCKGKGLLAADESTGTIGKRLTSCGLENNEVRLVEVLERLHISCYLLSCTHLCGYCPHHDPHP